MSTEAIDRYDLHKLVVILTTGLNDDTATQGALRDCIRKAYDLLSDARANAANRASSLNHVQAEDTEKGGPLPNRLGNTIRNHARVAVGMSDRNGVYVELTHAGERGINFTGLNAYTPNDLITALQAAEGSLAVKLTERYNELAKLLD